MNTETATGKIITFYSYKGGTGRSMALANVAWILAVNRKRVLVLDWDLEAPGLHRYFRPFILDKELTSSEGIIDFVSDFADEAITPCNEGEDVPADWYVPYADILRYAVSLKFPEFPEGGAIDFVPAGRQGPSYATRVNSFNWQNFYDRLGGWAFLDEARKVMQRNYDYILIDSRTGVSDTAGICTVQMPSTLVVLFTYNNQSIEGAAAVAHSVKQQRQQQSVPDEQGFNIFPVATRVDLSEQDKLAIRRKYAQAVFDKVINHLPQTNRKMYWGDVEVPYIAYLSYEEILAVFKDEPSDPKNSLSAMIRLTKYLTALPTVEFNLQLSPERRQEILQEYAQTPELSLPDTLTPTTMPTETLTEEQIRLAESFLSHLTVVQQNDARRLWLRLVRVTSPEDGGEHSKVRVRVRDLSKDALPLVETLVGSRLLAREGDLMSASSTAEVINESLVRNESTVEVINESLIRNWKRLHEWIDADMEFLLWRQKLREVIQDWEKSGQKNDFLLTGLLLRTAQRWLGVRSDDLNEEEKAFIRQSTALEPQPVQRPIGKNFASQALRAFIIRPFGTKAQINFDNVETMLIAPALDRLNISGRTTVNIFREGNIRIDMFQRLLTADLVIADLSVHNASVFYELGIRHALREKCTFLLRCDSNDYPFDLTETDRYLVYDRQDPAASLEVLTSALRQALDSNAQDSPVFKVLPNLLEQERSHFLAVPEDFRAEVRNAEKQRLPGTLRLLATEALDFEWGLEGLRLVGLAQFELRDFQAARLTWETLREFNPNNEEAHRLLCGIYQRLKLYKLSDLSAQRILEDAQTTSTERAKALSIIGSNAKTQWIDEWKAQPFVAYHPQYALRSSYLNDSYEAYARGFEEDLQYFYAGLNALGMLTIMTTLAAALPSVWAERFEDETEVERQLKLLQERAKHLAGVVETSLQAHKKRRDRALQVDMWADIGEADFILLTSKRPARVASAYRRVLADMPDFVVETVRKQLTIYKQLGVLEANVREALSVFPPPATGEKTDAVEAPKRIILFTGHMIDAPGRELTRFSPLEESIVREKLKDAIERGTTSPGNPVHGIAGGASGGDILFHEVCADMHIPSTIYLPIPREEYVSTVVAPSGSTWVERFNKLYAILETRVLNLSTSLPRWLNDKSNYSMWQRASLLMFYNALAEDRAGNGENITFITLWDGSTDAGAGSMQDLIERAKERGVKIMVLNINEPFNPPL